MNWTNSIIEQGLRTIAKTREPALEIVQDLMRDYHGPGPWENLNYCNLIIGDWIETLLHQIYAGKLSAELSPSFNEHKNKLMAWPSSIIYRQSTIDLGKPHQTLVSTIHQAITGKTDWHYEKDTTISLIQKPNIKHYINSGVTIASGGLEGKILLSKPNLTSGKIEWLSGIMQLNSLCQWHDLSHPFAATWKIDHNWRINTAKNNSRNDDLTYLTATLIPLLMPAVFLEGWNTYREHCLKITQYLGRPLAMLSAYGLHDSLPFKVLAAEWHDKGTLVMAHQHGGGYGLDQIIVAEEYERQVSDRFYSFGWTDNSPHIRALPAPMPTLSHNNSPCELLFVSEEYPSATYTLQFSPSPGRLEIFKRESEIFLQNINTLPNLAFRIKTNATPSHFYNSLEAATGQQQVNTYHLEPIETSYAKARLVVHGYLGTTWLQTLALGIPTVCFSPGECHSFREPAQPYIETLKEVGVLHSSGASAAKFVQSISANPKSWWQQHEVQFAVHEFVANYANYTQSWVPAWRQEFSTIIEEPT